MLSNEGPTVYVSKCAKEWDATPQADREMLFNREMVSVQQYKDKNADLVGKDVLMYKIDEKYYKEPEAWRLILGFSLTGIDVLGGGDSAHRRTTFLPKHFADSGSRLISTYRPTSQTLDLMGLKDGENTIGFEYSVADGVTDIIEVKLFVFHSKAKIIISDIDGTITK